MFLAGWLNECEHPLAHMDSRVNKYISFCPPLHKGLARTLLTGWEQTILKMGLGLTLHQKLQSIVISLTYMATSMLATISTTQYRLPMVEFGSLVDPE